MSLVLEADASGSLTIPADLLGSHAEHAKYIVELDGKELHIEPEEPRDELGRDDQLNRWRKLAAKISAVWPEGVSAVEAVSEQRR